MLRGGSQEFSRVASASLIDSPPEQAFDRITALASKLLRAPVSLVSVLDERRNFFKSATGLPDALEGVREVPLTHSFCKHVLASGEALSVPDTLGHPLVGNNPTIEQFGVRAYLGMPVRNPSGAVACSLCVLDMRVRDWSESEIALLADLAGILETEIMLREEVQSRRAAEEQAVLLVREMEHRVKNSLSTVQAIVSLTLKDVAQVGDLRITLLERISSLANTHTLLGAEWKSVILSDMLRNELGPYDRGGQIELDADGVRVAPSDAVVVGMVLHELTTNAVKYGALGKNGRLRVVCREMRVSESRRLHVDWIETRAPLDGEPARVGFGSTLLDTLVIRQHQGRISRDWTPEGLRLTLDMELGGLEAG